MQIDWETVAFIALVLLLGAVALWLIFIVVQFIFDYIGTILIIILFAGIIGAVIWAWRNRDIFFH